MDSAFPTNDSRGPRPDGGRGFRGNAENAKTRLCTRWLQGDCRFADRCNFAHGEAELRKMADRPDSVYGGPGRGGGRMGPGGYNGGGRGMGPGGYPSAGRGRGMYGDMGYGGGYGQGGGYGHGYGGGHVDYSRPSHMPEDVWAAQGYPVAGPNGWYMYRTKETGEAYFHNHRTNTTVWDRPPEWPAPAPGM